MHCQINGSPGWKWGVSGKCYPGPQGKERAARQGRAIKSSQYHNDAVPFIFSSVDFKKELIRQRQEQIIQAGGRLPSPQRKPTKPASGITLELSYFSTIKRLISPIQSVVKEILFPRLENIIETYKRETRTDTYGSLISETFGDMDIAFAGEFIESNVESVAGSMAQRTSDFNARQVDRQFISVLGVAPMRTERYLIPQIESFVERNVALIKTIPSDYFPKLETLVRTRIEEGVSTTRIKNEIVEKFGQLTNRSALIARDQINKFQGSLSRLRQMEVGVTHYIWVTAADERVRAAHRDADGKKVAWKSKGLAVGSKGEFLHPGFDYQCRCYGQPVLDDFISQSSRGENLLGFGIIMGGTF